MKKGAPKAETPANPSFPLVRGEGVKSGWRLKYAALGPGLANGSQVVDFATDSLRVVQDGECLRVERKLDALC